MPEDTAATGDAADVAVREFFTWIDELDRHDAAALLDQLPSADDDALAVALTRAVHAHPDITMGPVEVLAVVVILFNGDAIDRGVDPANRERIAAEAHSIAANRLRGIFATRQQAAFAAVRQLGTARVFGIPDADADAVELELGSRTQPASEKTIDLVERIAAQRYGWYLRHADRVGWVLFRTRDS